MSEVPLQVVMHAASSSDKGGKRMTLQQVVLHSQTFNPEPYTQNSTPQTLNSKPA